MEWRTAGGKFGQKAAINFLSCRVFRRFPPSLNPGLNPGTAVIHYKIHPTFLFDPWSPVAVSRTDNRQ